MTLSDRLKVYGFGLLIGIIIMLSIPKLRHNFFEYVAWGDSNEWVIRDIKYLSPSDFEIKIHRLLLAGSIDFEYSDVITSKLLSEFPALDGVMDQDSVKYVFYKSLIHGWEIKSERKSGENGSISFVMEYVDQNLGSECLVNCIFYEKDSLIIIKDYKMFKDLSKMCTYSDLVISKEINELKTKDLDRYDLFEVLDGGWVDRSKTEYLGKGFTLFVIDNYVNGNEFSVYFKYNEDKNRVIVYDFKINQGLSKRSYLSYIWIFLIFLIIMVPAFILVRKMMIRRNI